MNVLFVSQQLAALLVSRNVSPWLIAGCGAESQCLTAGKELARGKASLPPTSRAHVLINTCCLLVFIYTRFFGETA